MTVLLLFPTTRSVIRAEAACARGELACKVIPVPKPISAECGMSLRIDKADAAKAQELLAEAGIPVRLHDESRREEESGKEEAAFDLLTTVRYGGCSAKLSPDRLAEVLRDLPRFDDDRLLVGVDTHDDAGVYRLHDELAIIQSTDFFPPICSDAYDFGQIAAANALSDVFAMGGLPVTALNLVMFPAEGVPLSVLREVLRGGTDKIVEAGAVIVGGHTITDDPPKYGLAVTGTVHPARIITNAAARPGQRLILTKPLGTGAIVAGKRIGRVSTADYQAAIESMKLLNKAASELMQTFDVRCATDVTGFGLLGHALEMARASDCTLTIDSAAVPLLSGAYELVELGCIPGAAFRNQEFVEKDCRFSPAVDYHRKMLLLDPQTSGGLLMSVPPERADGVLHELNAAGHAHGTVIGEVLPGAQRRLVVQ